MADKRTEKSCYESRYGGGWIDAAKRLAEIMCERIAGNSTLGSRFWQNQPWDKLFVREITLANRLLKKPFSMQAIVSALQTNAGKRVKTFGAPFFLPMIEIEQSRLDLQSKNLAMASKPEPVNTLEKPRPMKRHGKSIRERLVDIEDAPSKE